MSSPSHKQVGPHEQGELQLAAATLQGGHSPKPLPQGPSCLLSVNQIQKSLGHTVQQPDKLG